MLRLPLGQTQAEANSTVLAGVSFQETQSKAEEEQPRAAWRGGLGEQ